MPGTSEGIGRKGPSVRAVEAGRLAHHLRRIDLDLRLAVSLRHELGFSGDEAAFVMGIDPARLEELAVRGLQQLHHLLAWDGLERLPAEIGETIGRLPPAPVPERLKAWLAQLVGQAAPEPGAPCGTEDGWTGSCE